MTKSSHFNCDPLALCQWCRLSDKSNPPPREPTKKQISKSAGEQAQGQVKGISTRTCREPGEDSGKILRGNIHFLIEPTARPSLPAEGTCRHKSREQRVLYRVTGESLRDERAPVRLEICSIHAICRFLDIALHIHCVFVGPFCKVFLVLEVCKTHSGSSSSTTMRKRDDTRGNAFGNRAVENLSQSSSIGGVNLFAVSSNDIPRSEPFQRRIPRSY